MGVTEFECRAKKVCRRDANVGPSLAPVEGGCFFAYARDYVALRVDRFKRHLLRVVLYEVVVMDQGARRGREGDPGDDCSPPVCSFHVSCVFPVCGFSDLFFFFGSWENLRVVGDLLCFFIETEDVIRFVPGL